MKILLKTASFAILSGLVGCGAGSETPETAKRLSPPPPPVQARELKRPDLSAISSIPGNASREQMDRGVENFVSAFSKSRSRDTRRILKALSGLREQPQLVISFVAYYDRLPKQDHTQRIATLSILGELKRPDAMPFLQKTVWTPMPSPQRFNEGLTPRDLEEMVIVKALEGLAFLRTADSDKALIDVMQRHESRAVRIAAIDCYMWNHDDTSEAAQSLYQMLPADLHKFVERPRFYRGMDRNQFNEKLKAWQGRWGAPNQ